MVVKGSPVIIEDNSNVNFILTVTEYPQITPKILLHVKKVMINVVHERVDTKVNNIPCAPVCGKLTLSDTNLCYILIMF